MDAGYARSCWNRYRQLSGVWESARDIVPPTLPSSATGDTAGRVEVGMGIAGGAPGVSAVLESDGDLAVIVLANLDEPIAEAISRNVFKPLGRALQRLQD